MRDVVAEIVTNSGTVVGKERCLLLAPELRRADVVVHNWLPGKDTAVDFTVVSGNLASRAVASASVSELSLTSRLDLATPEKLKKYSAG